MSKLSKSRILTFLVTGVSAIITAVLASYLYSQLTDKSPQLTYEIFPISSFENQNTKLSIVNIKISNSGNKEVENINGIITFADSVKVVEPKIEASPKSLKLSYTTDSSNSTAFACPMLNPSEQILFSYLVQSGLDKRDITVDLRGRGLQGKQFDQTPVGAMSSALFIGTIVMLVLTIALVLFIISHQRKVQKYNDTLHKMIEECLEYRRHRNGIVQF